MFRPWYAENLTDMFGMIHSPELREKVSLSVYLQHATAREVRSLLPPDCAGYFSFAFVRNPWDRMVSTFSRMDGHMAWRAFEAGYDLRGATFDEFVEVARVFRHVHLQPQAQILCDENGACGVDFLGRFDRLDQDFAVVAERLGVTVRLERHNSSSHEDYRKHYNDRSRRLVAELYREDIEAFGYEF